MVDGVQLIIASPPARRPRNADGSAHVAPVGSVVFSVLRARLFSIQSSRGAVYSVPYISAFDESANRTPRRAVHFELP